MTLYGRPSRYQIKHTLAERALGWLLRKLSGGRLDLIAHPQPSACRMGGGFYRGTRWHDTFTVTIQQTRITAMTWHNLEEARVDVFPKSRWTCDYYWPRYGK